MSKAGAVAAEVVGGGPEDPAADAVAAQQLASSRRRSSGGDWLNTGRAAYSRVSSPSAAAQTVTKLIWALALGLIALEIAAQATGQTWSLAIPNLGAQPPQKGAYLPLYAGQTSPAAAAMPGVFSGIVPVQGSLTNLSGRAGGNLAMG